MDSLADLACPSCPAVPANQPIQQDETFLQAACLLQVESNKRELHGSLLRGCMSVAMICHPDQNSYTKPFTLFVLLMHWLSTERRCLSSDSHTLPACVSPSSSVASCRTWGYHMAVIAEQSVPLLDELS